MPGAHQTRQDVSQDEGVSAKEVHALALLVYLVQQGRRPLCRHPNKPAFGGSRCHIHNTRCLRQVTLSVPNADDHLIPFLGTQLSHLNAQGWALDPFI